MLPAFICNFRASRYFLYEQINLAGMLATVQFRICLLSEIQRSKCAELQFCRSSCLDAKLDRPLRVFKTGAEGDSGPKRGLESCV
jgi:hypothetical protein